MSEKKKIVIVPKPVLNMEQIEAMAESRDEETRGERFYSKKFKALYDTHKILVELRRAKAGQRTDKNTITQEQAYNKAVEVMEKALGITE